MTVFTEWKGITAEVRRIEEEQTRVREEEDLSPSEREFFAGQAKVEVTQQMVDDLGPKRSEQMEGWIEAGLVEVVEDD